jgi:taurine dioxygenase
MLNKSFKIRPLTDTFGAEIYDIKLSGEVSIEDLAQIKALWNRYEILLFRQQDIGKDELVGFSRLLGSLETHVRSEWLNETHPEILQISNINVDGKPMSGCQDR